MNTIKIAALKRNLEVFGAENRYDTLEENISALMDSFTKEKFDTPFTSLSTYWYLHGDLQSMIGFDKGIIVNYSELPIKEFNVYNELTKINYDVISIEDGIYDVEVIGIDKPCIAYLWNDESRLRGLVCFKNDFEGCKEAYNKFVNKPLIL